ncbi:MAG TPA: cupin domain-containing protein [Phycisphaerae bacterium]|nr:cupin domain-containing protein [Phycisphaerae bacterium]
MLRFPSLVIPVILAAALSACTAVPSHEGTSIALLAETDTAPATAKTPVKIAREDLMDPIVLKDALSNIDAFEKTLDWKPFRPGVQIARIYNSPSNGPTAAFLKYEPGAAVPVHMHGGYEHIFILKGSQLDRSGEHFAGSVIINPPGSTHNVMSPNGCIVLIIWEKPVIISGA